jgi:hypothetical protein
MDRHTSLIGSRCKRAVLPVSGGLMMVVEAPAFPDRWVRIMCDTSASGVWDSEGLACDPEALPVTEDLRARLEA